MVRATLFVDPACPWGYSANPAHRALEWRYADGLDWRLVTIGLREDTKGLEQNGTTPASRVDGWRWFSETFGMPLLTTPRARLVASGRMCRAIKAAGRQGGDAERGMLRGVRMAWFASLHLLDEDEAFAAVAAGVPGLDSDRLLHDLADPAIEEAYQADRAEARSAAGIGDPAIAQDRAALFDGGARFTAPSLIFRHDGRTLVAGGFQSFEAYDVCVANLAPGLPRRPPPEPVELLAEYPDGLTTVEVAQVCRGRNDPPDIAGTKAALVSLAESGAIRRSAIGDASTLWQPAA